MKEITRPSAVVPAEGEDQEEVDLNQGEQQTDEYPELLQVSCGYFKNIVQKIMARKRLELLKYMLIDTEGRVFDALLHYSGEQYSLASLLMELM